MHLRILPQIRMQNGFISHETILFTHLIFDMSKLVFLKGWLVVWSYVIVVEMFPIEETLPEAQRTQKLTL